MGLGVWPGPGACGGSSWVPKPCGWQGGGVGAGDPAGPVHEVGQPRRPAGPAPGPTRSVPAAGAPALRAGGGGARADADADAGARPERGEAGPEPGAPGPAPGEGTRPGVWAAGSCRLRCRRRAVLNPESSSVGSSESRHLWILGENHSLMWTVTLIHLSSWPLFPMCLCINLCSLIKTPVVELRAHPSPVWPHFNLHPNYICKDCLFKYDVTLGKTLFNPGQ
ncbi:translation initiation factor IF-2-like isoform X3 [Camelus ferus]|uniref:Translation initiation factor IF-2-like isoform X3 n=1 Tax=Camelus ferus TaxID=419612 RepID=A0A8B8T3C2_CAMFR|nr:translation initiation factor IF-2-like isoform X3 [Camelus ferus]